MFRTLGVLFASALFATAAHATVTTIEYTPAEGDAITVAYDDTTNKATVVGGENDGATSDYTYDEASNTICSSDANEQQVCVTFEGAAGETQVGDSAGFTVKGGEADGGTGTAKVISVE